MGIRIYNNIIKVVNENNFTVISNLTEDIKTKERFTIQDFEGYRYEVSYDTHLRHFLTDNTCKLSSISPRNPYTIYNINNVWIPKNRPNCTLLSTIYKSNTQQLNWEINYDGKIYNFNMQWASFKNGYMPKELRGIESSKRQRATNVSDMVNTILKEKYKGWKLDENLDANYNNNDYIARFLHEDGYVSYKRIRMIQENQAMLLFSSAYPKESTNNIKLFLKKHYSHIKLKDGENFENFRTLITLVCDIHGEFNVYWENFFKRKQNCPLCASLNKSKGEKIIKDFFDCKNVNYSSQHTFDDCINADTNQKLRFDFVIFKDENLEEVKFALEYNGKQHFEPIDFFGGQAGFQEQQKRDKIKELYCKNKNIKLIKIDYTDFNILDKKLKEIIHVDNSPS